jgi:electron transfer flavoprotein alpha subunit
MILVFLETRDGKIKKSSLETLSEAARLAATLGATTEAVFAGAAGPGLAAEAFARGASRATALESDELSAYAPEAWAFALGALVSESKPQAVLFSATALGRDLAPRLAAKLGVGLASDCTKVAVKDGRLEFTRPVFAGKALLSLTLRTSPAMATLRPNIFPLGPDAPAQGEYVRKQVAVPGGLVKGRVVEILREPNAELDVAEAEIVVSGGRGLKGPENFALLKGLAAVLPRAAVGASRSAVDSGWIGHQHQVGQTGKTVSPNLYMAFGISGAIQHLAGMSGSKFIVAVNKDPEAPIFKVANYGILGDLFQIIPLLEEEFKKALA